MKIAILMLGILMLIQGCEKSKKKESIDLNEDIVSKEEVIQDIKVIQDTEKTDELKNDGQIKNSIEAPEEDIDVNKVDINTKTESNNTSEDDTFILDEDIGEK